MAFLAANAALRVTGRPQFLVFVIPWVRKKNGILCLKNREYSSSAPVRYVPKKYSKVKDSEDGTLLNSVEKNEMRNVRDELRDEVVRNGGSAVKDEKFRYQNRNEVSSEDNMRFDEVAKHVEKLQNQYRSEVFSKKRLSFGDDSVQVEKLQYQNHDEVSFKDDSKQVERLQMQNWNEIQSKNHLLFEEDVKQGVAELGLMEEHDEVSEEPEQSFEQMKIPTQRDRQKLSLGGKSAQDAENMAIKLLAKRAFTVVELRKKLNGKNFPPETVEAVLKDFKSRGLINDSLYAETYSRSRWSSSSWGPRRIKQALFNKGVSNSDADKAVKLVFNNAESDDSIESNFGMSKASMDHLFLQASKQWLRNQNSTPDTHKVRIIRWLQYRGFNWGVTNFIVKKLESQYPT